jgi:hypothetical protein
MTFACDYVPGFAGADLLPLRLRYEHGLEDIRPRDMPQLRYKSAGQNQQYSGGCNRKEKERVPFRLPRRALPSK